MMRRFQISSALTFAVLALSTPAAAQDGSEAAASRTPAGAQRFLDAIAKRGELMAANYASRETTMTLGITGITMQDDCTSRIDGEYGFQDSNAPALAGRFSDPAKAAEAEQFIARTGLPRPPLIIQWGKVRDVERTARPIPYSNWVDTPKHVRFNGLTWFFPDVRTAERAEFAIRFLIEQCGLPEQEGF